MAKRAKNAGISPKNENARLVLGDHEFREFGPIEAVFGAAAEDYPRAIPDQYRRMRGKGCDIASALFFNGGSLADHGRMLAPGVDGAQFMAALRALLSSFAPKHEVKIGTCGWLIDTYTIEQKDAA